MMECESSKKIKSLFVTYFDGCYEIDPEPYVSTTFTMGVCKLEYKANQNELIVHLRRPGLLIGKSGRIINALTKHLNCKISIIEVNLLHDSLDNDSVPLPIDNNKLRELFDELISAGRDMERRDRLQQTYLCEDMYFTDVKRRYKK